VEWRREGADKVPLNDFSQAAETLVLRRKGWKEAARQQFPNGGVISGSRIPQT
jgi:hypothetical protein